MRVVVDRLALDDRLELRRRLGELAVAEVGAPERLAHRALLGRPPGGLGERHGRPRRSCRPRAARRRGDTACRGRRLARRVGTAQCRTALSSGARSSLARSPRPGRGSRRRPPPSTRAARACSPAGSTIVTSLRSESKPISARETSLKTIASRPLRSSFARARSIASGAVLGREADHRLARAARAGELGEDVLGRLQPQLEAAALARAIFAGSRRRAARKSATAAAISRTWAARRTRPTTAAASSAVVSTSIRLDPGRRAASATLAATSVTSAPRRGGRARRAPGPSARSSGCR